MRMVGDSGRDLATALVGDVVIMAEVDADSTVVAGTPTTPAPVGQAADATSPNGSGHSEVVADSGTINMSFVDPLAVISYSGNGDIGLTSGYIQSATAGRGVIRIASNQAFAYNGTASTLVSGETATGAETLFIAARSVTMTTGTLTALGAGSTALNVIANGGAGLGALGVTVDGDILSEVGRAIILDQNNSAATGNVALTSMAGNSIASGNGTAVSIVADGSGTITVNLADSVSAAGGDGINIRNSTTGGDVHVTTAAVASQGAANDAIDVQSSSTTGDVTIVANGAIDSGDDGIIAALQNAAATGNVSITANGAIDDANSGILAINNGSGTITIVAVAAVDAVDDGISAVSSGGAISMTVGKASSVSDEAVDARQSNAAGSGAILITASGDLSGNVGIRAINAGSGSVTVEANGSVTGTGNDAIHITSSGASAGAIEVTTTGEVISARNGDGIDVDQQGTGDVEVLNEATINSGAIANGLLDGIDVNSFGTGNVTIENNGAIGTSGDQAQATAINGAINNITASGHVSISGTGDIFSVDDGIDIFINGFGSASVDYDGAIDSTTGHGIQVDTKSGSIAVTTGGAIHASVTHGIETTSTTGNQQIIVGGAVGGGLDGVLAVSTLGTIAVTINGGDVIGADEGIEVSSNGQKTVTVATGRLLSGDAAILSTGTGATTINNSGTITGTASAALSTTSATTVNNLAGATINGIVTMSALSDTIDNDGTIVGNVNLQGGADLYDGRNGSISGSVNGADGNDTLLGGAGAETLLGGLGVDILEGNGGTDSLTGGGDNDTFRGTAAGLNTDTIVDFAAGDRIVISDASLAGFSFSLVGNTLTYSGGSLTLTGFTGQLVASGASGGGVQLTVVPPVDARNDFNGDGRSDILWRNDNGVVVNWLGQPNGGFVGNAANLNIDVSDGWKVQGIGDYNGDGRDDILWRNVNGVVIDWLGQANGGMVSNHANLNIDVADALHVEGIGDFNGDGRDDILWRHDNGTVTNWLGQANGGFVDNAANISIDVTDDWHIEGIGDFNGDGRDDILWRNNSGTVTDWLGQANGSFVGNIANMSVNLTNDWQIQGVGDFNGDGRDDILWRNDNGVVVNWLGQPNGGFIGNGANLNIDVSDGWKVAGIGDYNGDGRDDILWRNSSGVVINWLGQANGGMVSNHANINIDVSDDWKIQSPDLI